jgi:putative transposase
MAEISYRRHRFPRVIIQHVVWLYLRFTLSYRFAEELLAERGLDISYETVRCWALKFGPVIARRLRRHRRRPSNRWHLDEMVVRIAGERMYLWRAIDHEGEVLDMLVQRRRDTFGPDLEAVGGTINVVAVIKMRTHAFCRLR